MQRIPRSLYLALLILLLAPATLAQQRPAAEASPLVAPGYERPAPTHAKASLNAETSGLELSPEAQAEVRARAEVRRQAALARLEQLRRAQPDPPKQRVAYTGRPSGDASRGGPTFIVNSAWDDPDTSPGDGICFTGYFGDECTLRAAIEEVNATAGTDPVRIEFDILYAPAGAEIAPAVWMIQVNHPFTSAGELPSITRVNTTLDGLTQPGASCGDLVGGTPHDLRVVLDGSLLASTFDDGITGYIDGFVVRGLVIQNMASGFGIDVYGIGTLVECNYVGVDYTGETAQPNFTGIHANGPFGVSTNTWIRNNLASGNQGYGIAVVGKGMSVLANLVGTDKDGTQPLPNGTFGGPTPYGGLLASGDDDVVDANVVSGNAGYGILVSTAEGGQVTRNTVGLARTGADLGLGNGHFGILVSATASNNDIGLPGAGNYVAASGSGGASGIVVEGGGTDGNRLRANIVGLDAFGNAASNFQGIGVIDDTFGSPNSTVIGGSAAGEGNVISGNVQWGLYLGSDVSTLVEGNIVGLDAAAFDAVSNGSGGIAFDGSMGSVARDNTISGNGGPGVLLADLVFGAPTGVLLEHNTIGTSPSGGALAPNSDDGIRCLNAVEARVGNTGAGQGNTIAFNGGTGVYLGSGCADAAVLGNLITGHAGDGIFNLSAADDAVLQNSLHANDGLGIDLWPDGPTVAGLGGAGQPANAPVLASVENDGTDALITFSLDGLPGQPHRIEFFTSAVPDPSGYGEGETWRAAGTVTPNAGGTVRVTLVRPAGSFPVGEWVTATASLEDGSAPAGQKGTSELSAAVQVQSAPPLTVTITPTHPLPPIVIARGQRLYFDLTFEVGPTGPSSFDYWTEAVLPNGSVRSPLLGPNTVLVTPPQTVTLSFSQRVPGAAPLGSYTYRAEAGTFPGTVLDSDGLTAQVVAAVREDEGDVAEEDWLVFDAEGREVEAGRVFDLRDGGSVERGSEGSAIAEAGSSEGAVPATFALHPPSPNPTRGAATVLFDVPGAASVRLSVYDVLGREVAVLAAGEVEAGTHRVVLGGASLQSGVYLVRLEAGGAAQTQRLTVVR